MIKIKLKATMAFAAVTATMCLGFAAPAFAEELPPDQTTVEQSTVVTTSTEQPAENTSTEPQAPQEEVTNDGSQSSEEAAPEPAPAPAEEAPASQPVVESAPAPAPEQVTSPQTTSQDVTTQNQDKPGKLQPVWCHLTGNDWKAQLGAKPSGGRHEAFPLMGDFGWGTTDEGQTLAHDRSSKLDAECGNQAPEPEPAKDASASVSVTPATCEAPATLVYGDIVNATFSGTADGTTGPGSYSVVATSTDASLHVFADGSATKTFSGTLDGVIPSQDTDPYAPCYVAPEETVTMEVLAASQTCEVDSSNMLAFLNDSDVAITVTLKQGSAQADVVVPGNEGVTLDDTWLAENGFAYGSAITFTGSAGDATVNFQGDSSWTPTDPAVVQSECWPPVLVNDAEASVSVSDATCTAPGTPTFSIKNAIWGEIVANEDGSFSRQADALEGHAFGGDMMTKTVTWTIPAQLKEQSTDSSKPCYVKPAENPKPPANPGTNGGGSDNEPTAGELAHTGSDMPLGTLFGGAGLLALGAVLMLMRRLQKQ